MEEYEHSFQQGITSVHWTKVTDVMLEKNPGIQRPNEL